MKTLEEKAALWKASNTLKPPVRQAHEIDGATVGESVEIEIHDSKTEEFYGEEARKIMANPDQLREAVKGYQETEQYKKERAGLTESHKLGGPGGMNK